MGYSGGSLQVRIGKSLGACVANDALCTRGCARVVGVGVEVMGERRGKEWSELSAWHPWL